MPPFRSRLRRATVFLVSIAVVTAAPLAGTQPAAAAPDAGLVRKLNRVLGDNRVEKSGTGAVVLDATTGEVLYNRGGSKALMPASNTKIVTAAAALETLKGSYRFETRVIRRAKVVDGVLQGRLYLKGYGDPTLRRADLERLAKQVRASGIRKVSGSLFVDTSFFEARQYNPGWSTSYADDYYAAPISALTLAPNADYDSGTVLINYKPGRTSRPATITTTPAAARKYIHISNKTTTSSSGTSTTFSASRNHGSNTITVRGRVPQGRSGSRLITVHRPELYAAAVFRAELARLKITITGSTKVGATPSAGRELIARDRSMRLHDLLIPFMKLSNNMNAEALTKAMSRETGGSGTWRGGLAVTTAYMKKIGTPMSGISLTDGSGLTRRNRLAARGLATFLQKIRSEDWYGAFYASMPVAGNSKRMVGGTLRYRMNGTRAANNARGKTGTLSGVTALSGYVTGRDGRRYTYSMISNYSGSTPRPVENTFVIALANWNG